MQEQIITIWQFILDFLNNSLFRASIFGIKVIIIIFSILLFIAITILRIKSWPWIKEEVRLRFRGTDIPVYTKPKMRRKWESIKKRMGTYEESAYKLAVIEADSMLDAILEAGGWPGENLEQRLKKMDVSHLSNLEAVISANHLRNKIADEFDTTEIKYHDAQEAIQAYEKALEELEAI